MDKIKDSGSLAQGSIPCGFTTKKAPVKLAEALLFHSDSDDYLPTAIFRVLIFPSVLTFTK